jgi:hypothetical protein
VIVFVLLASIPKDGVANMEQERRVDTRSSISSTSESDRIWGKREDDDFIPSGDDESGS